MISNSRLVLISCDFLIVSAAHQTQKKHPNMHQCHNNLLEDEVFFLQPISFGYDVTDLNKWNCALQYGVAVLVLL
jgi:hypothetical protein